MSKATVPMMAEPKYIGDRQHVDRRQWDAEGLWDTERRSGERRGLRFERSGGRKTRVLIRDQDPADWR